MGASQGIGRGIADGAGAGGGAGSRSPAARAERLEEAAAEIGERATPFVADAADLERLAALPGEVAEALGPVEILVTNTGGPPSGGALDHELEEWEEAYRSLVLAPRVLAGAVVPGMRERGWGRIVNVGSTSTREPIPGLDLSNAHRMAAVGFLKTLAARGRRRRDHGQHRRHRPLRHRAARPSRRLDGARRRGRPQPKCPPAASARPRSTATSSPSSAPSAPPTSPAP